MDKDCQGQCAEDFHCCAIGYGRNIAESGYQCLFFCFIMSKPTEKMTQTVQSRPRLREGGCIYGLRPVESSLSWKTHRVVV